MSDVDALGKVLRALAEARDGPFYSLYVDLSYRFKNSSPNFGFRIYRLADSVGAMLAVGVSVTRPDGTDIGWSLSLTTSPGSMLVTACVEITDDHGTDEVFERSVSATDCHEASTLISTLASEVCAERQWL